MCTAYYCILQIKHRCNCFQIRAPVYFKMCSIFVHSSVQSHQRKGAFLQSQAWYKLVVFLSEDGPNTIWVLYIYWSIYFLNGTKNKYNALCCKLYHLILYELFCFDWLVNSCFTDSEQHCSNILDENMFNKTYKLYRNEKRDGSTRPTTFDSYRKGLRVG